MKQQWTLVQSCMRHWRRWSVGVAAVGLGMCLFNLPSASAAACGERSGFLRMANYDVSPTNCGFVSGSNPDWSALAGNWNNKADYFYNNGNTHHVCVYAGTNYHQGWHMIRRGRGLTPTRNFGRSNNWTTSNDCPYGR